MYILASNPVKLDISLANGNLVVHINGRSQSKTEKLQSDRNRPKMHFKSSEVSRVKEGRGVAEGTNMTKAFLTRRSISFSIFSIFYYAIGDL